MSKKDWQVGPVLKEKLNSQGTLFRGGTQYSSDARYPRGYTPERQAAVREQIKGTDWQRPADEALDAHLQRNRIVDTVSRSTVPVEHLQGLQWGHAAKGQQITSTGNSAGAYFKGNGDAPMIGVKHGMERTSVPIHEIGHHVSHAIEGTEHSQNYSYESGHGGTEEAFADNYEQEHYRDRKGRQVEVGTYGGGQFAGHIQRSESFWKSYHQNRDNTLYKASVDRQNEEYYKKWPEDRVHPGGSQDVPLITKQYVSEDERKRGIIPEIDINDEALPHWSHKYSW
jgi:hypothetical protein